MKIHGIDIIFLSFIYNAASAPQQPTEINDQFQKPNDTETESKSDQHVDLPTITGEDTSVTTYKSETNRKDNDTKIIQTDKQANNNQVHMDRKDSEIDPYAAISQVNTQTKENEVDVDTKMDGILARAEVQPSFTEKVYNAVSSPIIKFIETPKVRTVLNNIGICIVNGAMEIVSFYMPAPLIPLIATAAGMLIPFEPVVMLRERMPVASYRRAFQTAVNTFLGTFDDYKTPDEDPYMTRKFNRRFMGHKSKEV